jgi:hypothetical protein
MAINGLLDISCLLSQKGWAVWPRCPLSPYSRASCCRKSLVIFGCLLQPQQSFSQEMRSFLQFIATIALSQICKQENNEHIRRTILIVATTCRAKKLIPRRTVCGMYPVTIVVLMSSHFKVLSCRLTKQRYKGHFLSDDKNPSIFRRETTYMPSGIGPVNPDDTSVRFRKFDRRLLNPSQRVRGSSSRLSHIERACVYSTNDLHSPWDSARQGRSIGCNERQRR